jgi:tubby-related protein 1
MQDRQSQLVLRRRQQINRHQQQILQLNDDSNLQQHHQTTYSREGLRTACLDYRDGSAHSISSFIGDVNVGIGGRPLLDDATSSYRRRIDILQRTAVGNNNRPISAPINNLQRGIRGGNNMMQYHSPSELTCTSTAIKHYASHHVNNDNDARLNNNEAAVVVVDDDDDGETDADCEETVSSKDTLYRLERELDRKQKELEEARAKLEERDEDADRLRAELERIQRNEEDSQQPDRQQQQQQQQRQQSSPTVVDNGQDSSKPTCLQTECQDGSARVNESSKVTTHSSGSDSGYQRYLNAYHHQPNQPSLTKQESDAATSSSTDISDITESCQGSTRRLSSTSLSRPISRARHSREASATNPTLSTPTVERQPLKDGNNSQEEGNAAVSDNNFQHRECPTSRSLPLLQQQLSSSIDSANLDDPVVMRSILMKPCPKGGGMVQCYIRRNKGMKSTLGLFPEYRCYLRGNNNSRTETFLMTSKKRTGSKTSNYLISMGRNDHDKDSNNILGKLRGNFQSTEYIIYDHGKNPNSSIDDDKNDEHHGGEGNNARIELGSVVYAPHSSLGKGGPRSITVGISNVDEEGDPVKIWQPLYNKSNDSMLDCLKQKTEEEVPKSMDERLLRLESKQPAWDETMQRFFLNFNGRVTMASVKNYQLEDANGDVCLQFGRTGKDEFILDVQWPLSPFQAFALALSSFDSKVGCD